MSILAKVVRAGESGADADHVVTSDPGGSPYRRYLPANDVRKTGAKKCFNATESRRFGGFRSAGRSKRNREKLVSDADAPKAN